MANLSSISIHIIDGDFNNNLLNGNGGLEMELEMECANFGTLELPSFPSYLLCRF
jgi:hypothetical protein